MSHTDIIVSVLQNSMQSGTK